MPIATRLCQAIPPKTSIKRVGIVTLVALCVASGIDPIALSEDLTRSRVVPGLLVPFSPSSGPALGNINGVRISIPANYLFSGVQYAREGSLQTVPRNIALDTKIDHFAILLRLSTLQPVSSDEDVRDLFNSRRTAHPFFYETWMSVGFYPKSYSPTDTLKTEIDSWMKDEARGPFVRQASLIAGLVDEVSVRPMDFSAGHFDPKREFLFDDGTYRTFIHCDSFVQLVAPYAPYSNCYHHFMISELKVMAEANYSKSNVDRWQEIEAEVRKIVRSFIVD